MLEPPIVAPPLHFFARATVEVGPSIDIGMTHEGERHVVPITGGTVEGDGWSGRILPFGADFQRHPAPGIAELQAHYVIEANDGSRIVVQNTAVRIGSKRDLQNAMPGRRVDPSRSYFRCVPRLTTAESSPHAWINGRVFVGTGQRAAEAVLVDFFAVG